MNRIVLTIPVFVVAISLVAAPGFAQLVCETTFDPPTAEGAWDDDNNWDPVEPDSTKVACIPSGKTAKVGTQSTPYAAHAEAVKVDATAEIFIDAGGSSLTLYDTANDGVSELDGEISVYWDSKLVANGVVLLSGSGTVEGYPYDTFAQPLVDTTQGSSLSIECDVPGGTEAQCVVMHGGLEITAYLINSAYVKADDRDNPGPAGANLVLSGEPKVGTGDGHWRATVNEAGTQGGVLDVQAPISDDPLMGGAIWEVMGHKDAEIRMNYAQSDLTGTVKITNGTFLFNENFDTFGHFRLRDDGSSNTVSRAIVAEGKVAKFHLDEE